GLDPGADLYGRARRSNVSIPSGERCTTLRISTTWIRSMELPCEDLGTRSAPSTRRSQRHPRRGLRTLQPGTTPTAARHENPEVCPPGSRSFVVGATIHSSPGGRDEVRTVDLRQARLA